jgi:hypothetical protein
MTQQELEDLFENLIEVRHKIGELKKEEEALKDKLKFYMKYKNLKTVSCLGFVARISNSVRRTLDQRLVAAAMRISEDELKNRYSSKTRYESFIIKKEKAKR